MKIKTNKVKLSSEGYYSLSVLKSDGSEVTDKRVDNCKNVVTYNGAYQIFFDGDMFSTYYAKVGTGTVEITRSSTSLGNPDIATSSSVSADRTGNEIDNGDGTSTLTLTRSMAFTLGALVGTFSEVGTHAGLSGSDLVAGQLIKDEFGAPTTITILADEQLVVTYTLELTVPNGGLAVQPVSGTGSVTTPEGTSTYNVYTQPYFSAYASIGDPSTYIRWIPSPSYTAYYLYDSAGNILANKEGVLGPISHNGTGTVTLVHVTVDTSPADFSFTDIAYISISGKDNQNTYAALDIATKRIITSNHPYAKIESVVEFSPPLIKDGTRSLYFETVTEFTV